MLVLRRHPERSEEPASRSRGERPFFRAPPHAPPKATPIHPTLTIAAAILTAFLDLYVGIRYCLKLIRKQSHPRLATWLIFELGVLMSLATYFASPDHSLLKAALNLTDALVVTLIILAILFEQRARRITFTRNEQLSLLIAALALAAWAITRTTWIAFLGFQLVMIVAYIPTLESMLHWRPTRSPEPLETWSINALAALLAVLIDVTGRHDYIAMLYPLRAFLLCLTIAALVLRWNHKTRSHQVHPS
ncbi:MAG: hypothetical protein WBY53_05400 [Acidobacteriaceae bacterium]